MNSSLRGYLKDKIIIGEEFIYLNREECVNSAITPNELIKLMEETLTYHAKGLYEMPPKIGIHTKPNTFMHAMPAFIKEKNLSGIKWITGYPDNREKFGLDQTVGLAILNDHETGYPLVLMDATWITTERTAAISMVGIKYLANLNAKTFGVIGCGAVGRKHIEFIEFVLPELEEIYIIDSYEPAMDKLITDYQPKINSKIIKASSYEELINNSEVITSATAFIRNAKPKIKDEWIKSGQTIIQCDAHTLYENKTMIRGDKYILDCLAHHKLFEKQGEYPNGIPKLYGELGEIVAGKKQGRENANELIINNNIGLAIEDIMLGSAISKKAVEQGGGQKINL